MGLSLVKLNAQRKAKTCRNCFCCSKFGLDLFAGEQNSSHERVCKCGLPREGLITVFSQWTCF